jgi:hypothetical protein
LLSIQNDDSKAIDDVAAVIETPAEDITLDLDSEELHYLRQETIRRL